MIRATPDSPRMFESNFVDFFSRTHAAVVPIVFLPASAALFWRGVSQAMVPLSVCVGLFVGGAVTWTLVEYWLHRTFFHWIPAGKWGERMHFLVHGVHHDWPRDKYRLVMPPAVSVTLFFIFLTIWYLVFGPRLVWAFHAGFVFGYTVYDVAHYYVHHFTPRTRYGKALRKHHLLHHFKNPELDYGVSSMVWDYVFRTKS